MGTGCTFSSLREAAKILYLKTVINLYIWSQNTLYKELVLQLFSTHDIDKFSKLEKKAMVKYIFIQKKKRKAKTTKTNGKQNKILSSLYLQNFVQIQAIFIHKIINHTTRAIIVWVK